MNECLAVPTYLLINAKNHPAEIAIYTYIKLYGKSNMINGVKVQLVNNDVEDIMSKMGYSRSTIFLGIKNLLAMKLIVRNHRFLYIELDPTPTLVSLPIQKGPAIEEAESVIEQPQALETINAEYEEEVEDLPQQVLFNKIELNHKIRGSGRYQKWRTKVLERDEYCCKSCGSLENLHVDHIVSLFTIISQDRLKTFEEVLNNDRIWDVSNGRVLCRDCHKNTESFGAKKIIDTPRIFISDTTESEISDPKNDNFLLRSLPKSVRINLNPLESPRITDNHLDPLESTASIYNNLNRIQSPKIIGSGTNSPEIHAEMKKNIEYAYGQIQTSFIPETPKPVAKTEYCSSDYIAGGAKFGTKSKNGSQKFVREFLENIYSMRGIDYCIPKSRLPKYYSRAKAIIAQVGEEDITKLIKWYLRSDRFASSGYNLDLLVSSPVINQFMAADPRDTRKGITEGFVDSDQVIKSGGPGGKIIESDKPFFDKNAGGKIY